MQFGAHIFGVGALADPVTLGEVARLAESLGYHSVFLADHVLVPRREEPLEDVVVNIGITRINPLDIFEIHPPPSCFRLGRTSAAMQSDIDDDVPRPP